jgi:NADPH:quinone reductase-like Zn-dependent oxidoreductase
VDGRATVVVTPQATLSRPPRGVLTPTTRDSHWGLPGTSRALADVLQGYLDAVAAGRLTVPIDRTYALDEIAQAHADMEHGRASGKLVVLT